MTPPLPFKKVFDMAHWTAYDPAESFPATAASVKENWARLHASDREPLPPSAKVLAAWVHFHRGEFEKAAQAGLKLGAEGVTVANKATCVYASYLEPSERQRLALFQEVAQRATEQTLAEPNNPNAHYWQAYALAQYSHGISVAKALAQGIGSKVKVALEKTIALEPLHVDAHLALGTFHAEVIDKVGALIGSMTYGAKKETSLALLERAMELAPKSAMAMVEMANALVMLEGDARAAEATALYDKAARTQPMDAMEQLAMAMAQTEDND